MPNLINSSLCTGCGACMNICPVNAISMTEDSEGFIQPDVNQDLCVDCLRCEEVCPVSSPDYSNQQPTCYAVKASDEERKNSSSGAFIPIIAYWVLQHGGTVYGAAWTKDWNVEHVRIDKLENLHRIRSSKYLQSDVRYTYRDALYDLKNGRYVLYTGTPCQVAGIKSFVALNNIDDEKLITIDVICHGTPNYKTFRKYLEENYDVEHIQSVNFRDKSVFQWSTTINIYFDDGRDSVHVRESKDSYYKSFLPCMIMRQSCANCPFSRIPRQGDFSAGDFWGCEQIDKGYNDRKGTSCILVNNKKAQTVFDDCISAFSLCDIVGLDDITRINKTVIHPFKAHSGRKHFFSSFSLKSFNELSDNSLHHKYDIGIVGLWYGINYGSVLTYYALYLLIRELGYDAVMLPKPDTLWDERFNRPDSLGQQFIWKYCNVFVPFGNMGEYRRTNDLCKDFVIGSDVVWNYNICGREADQFFFLDWVESGHKKIAFASSCGNGLSGPDDYVKKANYYLKDFDAISVRERISEESLRVSCGREDIELVLDPVFIVSKEHYENVAGNAKVTSDVPFVFAYILQRENVAEKKRLLNDLAAHYQADIKICANPMNIQYHQKVFGENVVPSVSVDDWVCFIKNCEFYIGDSYHALCFSLIFHRPFIILYHKEKGNAASWQRFSSLLELVGLEERFVTSFEDYEAISQLIYRPIDWAAVDERLSELAASSREWLKEALCKPGRPVSAEEYIVDKNSRLIAERQVEIESTKRTVSDMESRITRLLENQDESRSELEELRRQLEITNENLVRISNSKSWKLGRMITYIPRKMKRLFKK